MKLKFYSFIIIVLLMFCFSVLTFAQEDVVQDETIEATVVDVPLVGVSPNSWRQKLQEKIKERKEKAVETKEKVKAKLTEKARNRIKNIYSRVRERLEKRINRLEKLAERVENRMAFFEEKGRDTTEAQIKLAEFEEAIGTAGSDLKVVDEKIEELLVSEEPRFVFSKLRDSVKQVKNDISNARQLLSTAVNILVRNNQGGEDVE